MRLTNKTRWYLKLSHFAFVAMMLLICGLIAFLSYRYNFISDWTYNNRNSLSETSNTLLLALEEAPTFTIYANEASAARRVITETVQRYQQVLPDISVKYINPELEPDLMRELNISSSNALQVSLNNQSEFIPQLSEQHITNAIQRLARSKDRWLVFIDGHGERKPDGIANHDYGEWGKQLALKGIKYRTLNLADIPVIPENTAAVVIASPQVNYLSGEVDIIKQYLAKGGNLLWFSEPDTSFNLTPIADFLDLEFLPGTVHDDYTKSRGINDPRFVIVSKYPKLSVNDNFQLQTIFPFAHGITLRKSDTWQSMPILSSTQQSWSASSETPEKAPVNKQSFDIGVALVRDLVKSSPDKSGTETTKITSKQRILVLGDGDFASNMYQGNVGNLDLGLRFVNWILHDDHFIAIPARVAPDIKLSFSESSKIIIGLGFLILLPLLLAATGARVWLVRRRR